MKLANREGAIDKVNKKLMAVALSIAQRCEPCLKAHLKGAVEMGISREAINEAANLAISFGGCTAMMFYNEARKKFKL
jgi:AhpD family alkylhydroperoxidase